MAQVNGMSIFATIFCYKGPKLSPVFTRSAPRLGKHADIGVLLLLTYNMLYERVKCFQSNRLNLTIVRSCGADFPLPQTERFYFFVQ